MLSGKEEVGREVHRTPRDRSRFVDRPSYRRRGLNGLDPGGGTEVVGHSQVERVHRRVDIVVDLPKKLSPGILRLIYQATLTDLRWNLSFSICKMMDRFGSY